MCSYYILAIFLGFPVRGPHCSAFSGGSGGSGGGGAGAGAAGGAGAAAGAGAGGLCWCWWLVLVLVAGAGAGGWPYLWKLPNKQWGFGLGQSPSAIWVLGLTSRLAMPPRRLDPKHSTLNEPLVSKTPNPKA